MQIYCIWLDSPFSLSKARMFNIRKHLLRWKGCSEESTTLMGELCRGSLARLVRRWRQGYSATKLRIRLISSSIKDQVFTPSAFDQLLTDPLERALLTLSHLLPLVSLTSFPSCRSWRSSRLCNFKPSNSHWLIVRWPEPTFFCLFYALRRSLSQPFATPTSHSVVPCTYSRSQSSSRLFYLIWLEY